MTNTLHANQRSGTEYPVVIRELEGFSPLQFNDIDRKIRHRFYNDPRVDVVDAKMGQYAVRSRGAQEARVLSAKVEKELRDNLLFPVVDIKLQCLRGGGAILGLVTDTVAVEQIKDERRTAADIFQVKTISFFDMLPICSVYNVAEAGPVEDALRDYYLRDQSVELKLSPTTVKMLSAR